eukprot:3416288-Alexandrium_andersonii.AAC.1
MSASLVGSEMCIRDRSGASARFAPAGLLAARSPPLAAASSVARRRLLPSVSYTHLTLPTICSV